MKFLSFYKFCKIALSLKKIAYENAKQKLNLFLLKLESLNYTNFKSTDK